MRFGTTRNTTGPDYDRSLMRFLEAAGGTGDQSLGDMLRLMDMEADQLSLPNHGATHTRLLEGMRGKVLLAMENMLRNKRISAADHLVVQHHRLSVIEAGSAAAIMRSVEAAWPIVQRIFPVDRPAE